MANNKTKIDRIHDQMPRYFKTRSNPNWNTLISALGQSDQNLANLVEEVKKQFFLKTAQRPYLDKLGSNFKVSRPKFIGMDDPTFRTYIPVLAYQPKQVKLVLDLLLDIFFFKESTTSFTQSEGFEPYNLRDGWKIEYTVDGTKEESIVFKTNDFTDINNATAEEIAGAINRKAQYSFAIVFDDRILKRKFLRIFTNTIGSKGSIQVTGGRANMQFKFTGFNNDSGSGTNTVWDITKIGDTMNFKHISGTSPNLNKVVAGDVAIIDIPGNEGSFLITKVDIGEGAFEFVNLFGTAGTFDHSINPDSAVRFMALEKSVIYTNTNRAVVWEVSPGEIIVEIPASPPVVKRDLSGSAHINGVVDTVINTVSSTELELDNAEDWPFLGGQFIIKNIDEIKTRILTDTEDEVIQNTLETRFNKNNSYTYTSKVGNVLTGITPDLPEVSSIFEHTILTAERQIGHSVLVETLTPHNFKLNEAVRIQNTLSTLSTTSLRIDINASDTDADVAAKMAARINAEPDFSATSLGPIVEITNSNIGPSTDAADIDSNVTIAVSQQGTITLPEITHVTVDASSAYDVAGNGLRFEISNANDTTRYHVWFNVIDGINAPQINPGLNNDDINGTFIISEINSPTKFTYISSGELGIKVGGLARVERIKMANSGSLAFLTSAQLNTGIIGPNMWDSNAAYVLSSLTTNSQDEIKAGNNVRTLNISPINSIPDEEGFVIFGFGTENEEGPIRYLFKPTSSSMQLDPAYVFQNNHEVNESVTVIRRRGAHVISSTGKEFAPYITDPSIAREVLQELLRQTKSVGIFIDFLVRFPEQLYATLDVYRSENEDLYPVNQAGSTE